MPDATTAALLALWERCPETKPDMRLIPGHTPKHDGDTGHDPFFAIGLTGPPLTPIEAHDIAAGAIERWLLAQGMRVDVRQWPATDPRGAYTLVDVWTSDHPLVPADAPTKLPALIAAANAVLDRKGAGDAE